MRRLMPRIYDGADRTSNPQDVADAIAALIALPLASGPCECTHYYQQIDLLPAITLARN